MMSKLKPVLPTLREKKRYLVFEAITKDKNLEMSSVTDAILKSGHEFLGNVGMAKAGIIMLSNLNDNINMRGILRVNNKMLDSVKSSMCLVDTVNGKRVLLKSIGVSGILKKAKTKFLAS